MDELDVLGLVEDIKLVRDKLLKYSPTLGPTMLVLSLFAIIASVFLDGGRETMIGAMFLIIGGVWYKLPEILQVDTEEKTDKEDGIL